jgi:hypothetical protein
MNESPAASAADSVVKDMSLTTDDLFRGLPAALRGLDYRIDGLRVEIGTSEHGATIALRALPPRRLSGLLSLPRTEVTLSFHGYDAAEAAAFVQRFDRAYQRAGG